jgi:secondary thiamine-phosphate synthase enzyme
VYHEQIKIGTHHEGEMVDITGDVQSVVHASGFHEGIVCVFIPGSTGAITTIEFEPGLQKDLPRALERLAPADIPYEHHETWHDDNGRSHVRASILGPSLSVPFHDGALIHGTWQQIVFIELDTRSRTRDLFVQVIGE